MPGCAKAARSTRSSISTRRCATPRTNCACCPNTIAATICTRAISATEQWATRSTSRCSIRASFKSRSLRAQRSNLDLSELSAHETATPSFGRLAMTTQSERNPRYAARSRPKDGVAVSCAESPDRSRLLRCARNDRDLKLALIEQREVDRVAHCSVAEIARVQMVAAIVFGQHAQFVLGVAQRRVEIDDRVERAAFAQPGIDLLAHRLAPRVPGAGEEGLVPEGGQGAADHRDAVRPAAQRELLQAGDHLRRIHLLLGLGAAVPQVVGAEHDHGVGHPGLGDDVAVKAPEAAVAADVMQDAVAAEALVHYRGRASAPSIDPGGEAPRQD